MSWWRFSKRATEAVPEPRAHAIEPNSRPHNPEQLAPFQGTLSVESAPKTLSHAAGEPIPEQQRTRLESGFNRDFSHVRIHLDSDAAEASQEARAKALTSGRDIYFSPGAYSDLTLAHELAHVVQQSERASPAITEDSLLESEARATAATVISGGMATLSPAPAAPAMQREPLPGSKSFKLLPSYSLILDNFDIDKSVLSAQHKAQLEEFAKRLKATLQSSPDSFVTVVGFADQPGTEAHNLGLGQQRAEAVLNYLVQLGVPATVMHATSLGEELPRVPSKGYEAKNRRVEIDMTARSFFNVPMGLTPPSQLQPPAPLPKPPVDLTYHPHLPTPEEEVQENIRRNEEIWKEAQQILAREKAKPGTSVADVFGRAAREITRKLGLPKWVQDRAESLAQDLPAKGAQAVFDQLAAEKEMTVEEKNAVHAVIDAFMKTKLK